MPDTARSKRPVPVVIFALLLSVGLTAGQAVRAQEDPATPEASEAQDPVPYAFPMSGPFDAAGVEIKNDQEIADWFRSAHADAAAEAFRHWDEEEEITAVCATCHSGAGFRDFHGLDGSEAGVVNGPIEPGGVVDCGTCHNAGLADVTEVVFPSGLRHPVQGVEASCMTCHQGRTSGKQVSEVVAEMELDTPNPDLRFINPHYATAAATWLGGYGASGYHYEGRDYAGRFFHAPPVASCNSCHDPHTLEVAFEPCQTCHLADSPQSIRIARQSYDGSGDTSKGIKADIETNAAILLDMVKAYATEVAGVPILYDGSRYPYFFADANGDGAIDQAANGPAAYGAWTPRSLRATYNWKLVTADPGNYAHNPVYVLQLLYDSIADLGGPLGVDIDDMDLRR